MQNRQDAINHNLPSRNWPPEPLPLLGRARRPHEAPASEGSAAPLPLCCSPSSGSTPFEPRKDQSPSRTQRLRIQQICPTPRALGAPQCQHNPNVKLTETCQ